MVSLVPTDVLISVLKKLFIALDIELPLVIKMLSLYIVLDTNGSAEVPEILTTF